MTELQAATGQGGGSMAPRRPAAPARRAGKFVAVRCTPDEYAALQAKAAAAGLTVSGYLRAAALGSPGVRSARRPPVEREELARALGLLGRYGGNLNQLARMANTTGALPTEAALVALGDEVRAVRDALMRALGRDPGHGHQG